MGWGLFWSALAVTAAAAVGAGADLVVTAVDRQIDLSSQLVKIQTTLSVSNEGKSAVPSIFFPVSSAEKGHVVFIQATVGTADKTYLRVKEVSAAETGLAAAAPAGTAFYKIDLKSSLSAGGSQAALTVELVIAKSLEMLPTEITQREKQLVIYNGNHFAFLPYAVAAQTTKVTLPTANVESYSKLKPVAQADATITYGPYTKTEPFSHDAMSVHYENNNPFLIVTRLERVIEISMWGNIAVEETLDVRHAGATLKGSFSRYDFQRDNSGVASVKNFKTVLPAAAADVYYRDDIGNISTSNMRILDDAVELDIRPRFPLFGGWKTHYMIGYNVPSYEYLFRKSDNFALNMRLVDHIFDDMVVEELTVKVILPEGAQVGKLHTPIPMSRQADHLHFTYLDTTGRPVVTVTNVADLTEKHIQDFQLEFKFPKTMMIREPLLLIAAFFIFFALAIVYVRMDFAITKDEVSEAKLKVAGYCEKIQSHQDTRASCYTHLDEALSKLKSTKDSTAFGAATKKINAEHKAETAAIAELNIAEIKAVAPDTAEKIAELQKYDRTFREHQTSQAALVEKLVTGKLNKQQFIEQEAVIVRKKSEAIDKINAIVAAL